MNPKNKTLLVIAGPTAVGKTDTAIKLAQHYKTAIVSADSRQFYKEISIGTAKPDAAELAAALHYFIGSHSITENFTVGDYEREALQTLDALFKAHDVVILAGGSGLFIKAVCEGFDDLPSTDASIRERLNAELATNGIESLQQKLKTADPEYYSQIDLHNPQRVIRALEVFESTGQPFSSFRKAEPAARPFRTVKVALDLPREVLYQRINERVDKMMDLGLLDEVRSLVPFKHLNALQTVGYTELFDYLDGNITLDAAVEAIKQNTRRFAKRQLTWFRKDEEMHWLDASAGDIAQQIIKLTDN